MIEIDTFKASFIPWQCLFRKLHKKQQHMSCCSHALEKQNPHLKDISCPAVHITHIEAYGKDVHVMGEELMVKIEMETQTSPTQVHSIVRRYIT